MTLNVESETEYEDLLSLWADLEAGLGVLLSSPYSVQEFIQRVGQYDRWMQTLLKRDTDTGLYLLFQLAAQSPVGYSASHALVCAVLAHLVGAELQIDPAERNAMVAATLTMNIGMTALQDELASQLEKPSPEQQAGIRGHTALGRQMLVELGVTDPLWLDIVGHHHDEIADDQPLATLTPVQRLARIVRTVDRYGAMISPRKSRAGRSATDSVRAIVGQEVDQRDEVSYTLVRSIGLCPPGTFVKLDNGETAIVLRRSDKANHPLVASLLDKTGNHRSQPSLYQTASGKPRIQSALARSAVSLELNHRTMVRLGLYAAQRSAGLRGLVTAPGAL